MARRRRTEASEQPEPPPEWVTKYQPEVWEPLARADTSLYQDIAAEWKMGEERRVQMGGHALWTAARVKWLEEHGVSRRDASRDPRYRVEWGPVEVTFDPAGAW
jgi:hypothetical protein